MEKQNSDLSAPAIESIRANDLVLKTREDRAAFKSVLKRVLPAASPQDSLEPVVLLYDLDKDGLSEIILAEKNIIFRNRGNMRFEPERFVSNRIQKIFTGLIGDFSGDGKPDHGIF
jgi:hypothetical protein